MVCGVWCVVCGGWVLEFGVEGGREADKNLSCRTSSSVRLWWELNEPNGPRRFRGGLVVKAHRLVYHSTLGSRVIKKKNKGPRRPQKRRVAKKKSIARQKKVLTSSHFEPSLDALSLWSDVISSIQILSQVRQLIWMYGEPKLTQAELGCKTNLSEIYG